MNYKISFSLSTIAGICFVLSFFYPFLCSDFELDLPIIDDIDKPCESITPQVITYGKNAFEENVKDKPILNLTPSLIPWSEISTEAVDYCKDNAEESIIDFSSDLLESNLGQIRDIKTGKMISWRQCIRQMQPPKERKFKGSCCSPAKSATEACFKMWLAKDMGLGEKGISDIIEELFKKQSYILGTVIVFFSIIFPISKVVLTMFLSVNPSNKKIRSLLEKLSKWSMADVFIASLSIIFFKSEALGFAFTPQVGLYLFAVAAILSSFALHFISKDLP